MESYRDFEITRWERSDKFSTYIKKRAFYCCFCARLPCDLTFKWHIKHGDPK